MKIVAITLAALTALALLLPRIPGVQDFLFDRALERNFGRSPADLFDGDGLKVFFCGTGSPLPSAKRAQTCTAVFAGDWFFLVDAGSGSFESIPAAGVPASRLAGIFLTHLHSDHIGDLSEANLQSWVTGRASPLPVYGPAGVERVVAGENEAFALDAEYRTAHHGEGIAPPAGAGMSAVAFDGRTAAVVFEGEGLAVTAFPVKHDPVVPAVGYRFDYKGRSVVISGDTAPSPSLIEHARGADVLIHEAQANHMVAKFEQAAAKAGNEKAAKIFSDIPDYHTSPEDAARAANEARADWLILTHLTPAPDNPVAKRIFMRRVASIRPRHVVIAEDGMFVSLPEAGGAKVRRR
jgi:ribonuclease Z